MLKQVVKKSLALFCALLICLCAMCGCEKEDPNTINTVLPDENDDTVQYPVSEQEEIDQAGTLLAGAQWSLADLEGTWKLESAEIEGCKFSAEEEGMYGSVSFFFDDQALRANYVQSDDYGNRTEIVDAIVVYLDMPLFDGCANESWCVELIGDDDSVKCYAAILDRENLMMLVETYFDDYEYPAVSVQYFSWQGTGAVG